MKQCRIILFTIIIMVMTSTSALFGQNIQIKGSVYDQYKSPLGWASVVEKGTTNGVNTSKDGTFSIIVSKIPTVLEISFLGMLTEEIPINSSSEQISVTLKDDAIGLQEVVTIGYGTVKKEEITSSVSRVKSENFIQGAISSPAQLIQGKVAGLGISKTSGEPGSGVSIQLRGISTLAASSSPLIVIDGVAGGALNAIAPEDIESFDVLKDGSAAAIYGTRGTNGVIIVNTKKMTEGKRSISYSGYGNVGTMVAEEAYPDAKETRELREMPEFSALNDYGASTDWVREIIRVPISQSHHISISGGSKSSNYVASATYTNMEGLYKPSYQESIAAKVYINHSMYNDRIRVIFNIDDKAVKHGSTSSNLYSRALLRNPTIPVYNEDGTYYENSNGANPVGILNECVGVNNFNQLLMNGKIIIEPVRNLKLSAMGAYMADYNQYEYSTTHKAYQATMGSEWGSARLTSGHGQDITMELQADYSLDIDEHSIDALIGYSYNKYVYQTGSMYAFDFPIDGFGAWNMGSANSTLEGLSTLSSNKYESKLIGFYGRVNYNFSNRYLASISLRNEGSDKFGANNRWGWFPAASIGWRISNESWMKNVKWVNDLKLRLGYGVTGTAPSSVYQYIALYNFNTSYMSYSDGKWVNGIIPSNNPNPDLKWEEKHELNAGIDFSLLDNKIYGSIDGYYRYTKDLLYTYTVPTPPNISNSMLANVGSISNAGVEFSIGADFVRTQDMKLSVNGNVSYNANKLISLSNDKYTLEYLKLGNLDHVQTYSHRLQDGWAIGNFYGYKVLGLKNKGKAWRIEGAENSDPGEDQKQIIGNGMPKMFAALQLNYRYKNLDFMLSFRGAFMYQILNQYRMKYETLAWLSSVNIPKSAYEKIGENYNYAPSTYSDYYIEDGDFVKLDNITIGYNFNIQKVKFIQSARIYVAGQNLFTFSKYSGLDPEAVSITGLTPGVDSYEKYPTMRSFSLGVNITF